MKANRRLRPLCIFAVAGLAALAGSCSEKRIIPAPTPRPTPRTLPPAPPPAPPTALDWQQAPITPGNWSWGVEGGQSVARFAAGAFVIRCERTSGAITLQRTGAVAGAVPLTVITSSVVRTLPAAPQSGSLSVTLRARDPLIDAMIFSRGRFAIEAPGLAPLYIPSWPEISRVAEDCR